VSPRLPLDRVEGLPIIVVFAVLIACFIIASPEVFLSLPIYMSFLTTVPPVLVLALGLTFVIAAGEIDLSFPSIIAFSGYVLAMLYRDHQLVWPAVLAAVAAGALIGLINGLIVAYVGVPSIITTLATEFFWGGITTVISGGTSYSLRTVQDTSMWAVFVGKIGEFPLQALWAIGLTILLWFILNRHRFGEHVLFIGDNANVARVVGVNVDRERVKLFTLMGTLAGFAAVLLTLENRNFFNTQGQGYLLIALASVFIGGTSIFGGQATIVGTFFGAFIISMIEAGLTATGIQGFWVRAVVGLVFLAAVIFHLTMEQPQRRAKLAGVLGLRAGH
jgi:simple sugar transport system permease protein